MGIGISGCVNTSLSRRIEREQSETSTPAHCLRLGINKSIALGYGCRHGNRRPIRALSHSPSLSLSRSLPLPPSSPPCSRSPSLSLSFSLYLSLSLVLFPLSPCATPHSPTNPSQFISPSLFDPRTYAPSVLCTLLRLPFSSSYAASVLLLPPLACIPPLLFCPTGAPQKFRIAPREFAAAIELMPGRNALKLGSLREFVATTAI